MLRLRKYPVQKTYAVHSEELSTVSLKESHCVIYSEKKSEYLLFMFTKFHTKMSKTKTHPKAIHNQVKQHPIWVHPVIDPTL